MYGAWLIVKCGETSGKQTWTRKLRTASTSSGNTGTWESSFSDTNLSGDSWIGSGANSAKTAYMKIGEGYSKAMDAIGALNPPTYTDEQFLKDVKKYNGIEFNIK